MPETGSVISPNSPSAWARRLRLIALVAISAGAFLYFVLIPIAFDPVNTARAPAPVGVSQPVYVDETRCGSCHSVEFSQWQGSHHDLAMQEATEDSVLGDFGDVTFTGAGLTSRFFTRDGRFFVDTEDFGQPPAEFEIAYTFGVEPLQQYLVARPGGRLQSFPIAWDTERGQWFHLAGDAFIDPEDPLHWTGLYQNWNLMCANCHSTNLEKNYDSRSDTYDTSWSAIDVGCQGCHGPAGDHLTWADERAADQAEGGTDTGLLVDFRGRSREYEVEQCAACHSRRVPITVSYVPGEPLLDHYVPELLREGLYHPDGQILDEVYVYGSFVQSRMYDSGVGCSDCHDPHSLQLVESGNDLCTQCHQAAGAPLGRFPTLGSADYDTPEHHMHESGTTAAQCVNCHMTDRTYMVVDPRRDHSFRIPRPDLSISTGAPNACTACHADRTAAWAVEVVDAWYPDRADPDRHYGEVLAGARTGVPDSLGALVELAGDRSEPAIVRATALDLLGTFGVEGLAAAARHVDDPDPLVRLNAIAGLDALQPAGRVEALSELLGDPVRAPRLEAARRLALAGSVPTTPAARQAFVEALDEYEAAQEFLADTPAARVNMAVLDSARGDVAGARAEYQSALAMDPFFTPASLNLATLLNRSGENAGAIGVLEDAIRRTPEAGELHYALGLILGETGRMREASESLGRGVDLLPSEARIRYNYGISLQQLGLPDAAEAEYLAANRIEPGNPAFVEALVILYVQQARWSDALGYARQLVTLAPGDANARSLLADVTVRAQAADQN